MDLLADVPMLEPEGAEGQGSSGRADLLEMKGNRTRRVLDSFLVRMNSQGRGCGGCYWEEWVCTPAGTPRLADMAEGQERTKSSPDVVEDTGVCSIDGPDVMGF